MAFNSNKTYKTIFLVRFCSQKFYKYSRATDAIFFCFLINLVFDAEKARRKIALNITDIMRFDVKLSSENIAH